ncbi:MAG: hypothetical protein HY037_06780 [Nitrospirae bacterium]|nr:hypothetical protein [Candidatus Troglogloeales bacterium]
MIRPAFKRYLSITAFSEKEIVFGSEYGIATIIYKPDKCLIELIGLLDGRHEFPEILSKMSQSKYPLTKGNLQKILQLLVSHGLVEDLEQQKASNLSQEELERYDRQLVFFSMFAKSRTNQYNYRNCSGY